MLQTVNIVLTNHKPVASWVFYFCLFLWVRHSAKCFFPSKPLAQSWTLSFPLRIGLSAGSQLGFWKLNLPAWQALEHSLTPSHHLKSVAPTTHPPSFTQMPFTYTWSTNERKPPPVFCTHIPCASLVPLLKCLHLSDSMPTEKTAMSSMDSVLR